MVTLRAAAVYRNLASSTDYRVVVVLDVVFLVHVPYPTQEVPGETSSFPYLLPLSRDPSTDDKPLTTNDPHPPFVPVNRKRVYLTQTQPPW